MLNEKKIRLMTKLALYEKDEFNKEVRINRLDRSDYISLRMIYTAILATISYVLMLSIWVIYKIDFFVKNINNINYIGIGIILFIFYIIFLIFYFFVARRFFSKRYKTMSDNMENYNDNLRKLHKMYRIESKMKEEKEIEIGEENNDNVEIFND